MSSLALEISRSNSQQKPWTLPAQGMAVYYGCPQVHKLSHHFLPQVLLEGKQVLYLDGANHFDPLLLMRLAKQHERDRQEFNRHIRVARAFTCFQLTELLCRVPRLLEGFPANITIVTAFPELYFDEDLRESDAIPSFNRGLQALRELANRLSVAVFSDPASFSSPRRKLFDQVKTCAEQVWRFTVNENSTPAIGNERTARPALFSARG